MEVLPLLLFGKNSLNTKDQHRETKQGLKFHITFKTDWRWNHRQVKEPSELRELPWECHQ
jgi:hypothetical protein